MGKKIKSQKPLKLRKNRMKLIKQLKSNNEVLSSL